MVSVLCIERVLLAVVLLHGAVSQLNCNIHKNVFLQPNTNKSTFSMPCQVDASAVLSSPEEYAWEWVRLGLDRITIRERITNGVTIERMSSNYTLPVECEHSGFYQALYRSGSSSGSCLFSCFFVLEVEEVRESVLRMEFSVYSVITGTPSSIPSEGSTTISGRTGNVQHVGTCGNKFYLKSTCLVEVSSNWYRNGTLFDPQRDPENYLLFTSGELRIQSLTNSTVGYYACVTTLSNLGSYLTRAVNIILALPTAIPSTTPTTSTTSSSVVTTVVAVNPFGTLTTLQFGVIIGVVSLVIIVMLLIGVVCMACMTVKRRKEARPHNQRPISMMEEVLMMEEAQVEEVDFAGPIDIQFNSILFEELLHKGTFKVVHHGIVNQPINGMLSVPVAVKRLKDEKSELGYEELMNEAHMLKAFQEKAGSHPNIVSMVGLTTDGGPTCLLLEFIPNGTLDDFLVALMEGPIPEWYTKLVRSTLRGAYHKHVSGDIMSIILQVADGMKFLTDHGFIHRDLSTRNILMGDRLNVKIVNPGMHHEGYYYVVSERERFLQDMAPECLWDKCYSVCSDAWSYGILVYRTVTFNSIPFPNVEVNELHGRMVGGERPQLLASFSNELYFLLQRCWQFVATERPSFSTILSDLSHMAEKPTRHIILKATKDYTKPGYLSDNGQVFLRALQPGTLEEDEATHNKKSRSSGTMRSLISSIDDTMYTRETAETVLDFTQSETENDNYEQYLKGDIPPSFPSKEVKQQSYDETDTSGNDVNPSTREWVKSTRKVSKIHFEWTASDNVEVTSAGKGLVTSGKKKKRRVPSASKEKAAAGKKVTKSGKLSKSSAAAAVKDDSGDVSSDGAPSITEDDDKERGTSDPSGSDVNESHDELQLVQL